MKLGSSARSLATMRARAISKDIRRGRFFIDTGSRVKVMQVGFAIGRVHLSKDA
jgi:hypothetical protein